MTGKKQGWAEGVPDAYKAAVREMFAGIPEAQAVLDAADAADDTVRRAAPELLEACKLAYEQLRPGNVRTDSAGHIAKAALGKAIAKAEGRL